MALGKDERLKRLVEWHLLSDEQRASLGYPATRAELAKLLETSDKTLQRDQGTDAFKELLEGRRAALAARAGVLPVETAAAALTAVAAGGDTTVEGLDALVPRALMRLAAMSDGGDRDATKALLTLPHVRTWLEDQAKAAAVDFSESSQADLVAETVALAGAEAVAAALTAAGWHCVPPEAREAATEAAEPAGEPR